ncbi:hypothetical protein BBJ28_00013634 [Nothophytophthora sp. Chile5]|nr:hypothetical protein BBJ28_00013634 [Nothophytophthora sp. Chile5]
MPSTDHLGVPNPLRSAVCFDVLVKLSRKFPRFQTLTSVTQTELERAAYMNASYRTSEPMDEASAVSHVAAEALQTSLARRAYFSELKDVLTEKESLERQLSRLDALHVFMLKRLRNNELMVDRLAHRWGWLVMRQTLAYWKKIIIRKKYTRVLLEKTSRRWTRQRLARLFRHWNDYAVTEKVRKSHEQIQQCRDQKHDLQELISRLLTQIEGAKVEMKAHREHLDLAKRHTLSLEELLAQLELRVRQSQERKLQTIANQWGKLCFTFVDCECDYLQNMLDAVPADQYVDVNALLLKGEDESDLLRLPSELLVLRWINFQLAQCGNFFRHFLPCSTGFVQNFSTDMRNHYVLRHIVNRIVTRNRRQPRRPVRTASTFALLSRVAAERAIPNASTRQPLFTNPEELRAVLTEQLNPACPSFLSDLVLSNDMASDLVFCVFAFLVCEHPSLSSQSPAVGQVANEVDGSPWYDAQVALNDARAMWETVRSQWSELQTPFDVVTANKTTPEMTSPPQLLAKANIALQNAVNMVQYACSKRSSAMRLWGCLKRRIQQDAIRLLAHRGRELPPFELVDRRVWREKYMLTTLPIAKLVQSFLGENGCQQTGEEFTTELHQVEVVLTEHYQQLRRIYRHYANVDSNRIHLVASMESQQQRSGDDAAEEARFFHKISACISLVEFHAFLKDCQVFGKSQSFPYDFVQKVVELVSVEVAAAMDTATLTLPPSHTLFSSLKERGNGSAREMTPAEFVEALVHIVRSGRVYWKGGDGGPTGTLALRMRRCLEEIIEPNAMQPDEEKGSVFRSQLLTFACREVFTTHQKTLRSLYTHFAANEVRVGRSDASLEGSGVRGSTKMLSVNGFVNCCYYFDLFRDNLLHLDDVQHILAETLQRERESIHFDLSSPTASSLDPVSTTVMEAGSSEPNRTPKHDHHDEEEVLLTLAEFLEALAAVACYLNPDAFVPLAGKLDTFFTERLASNTIAS